MKILGWVLAAAFAGLSLWLAYSFVLVGKVEPADDGRTAVLVSAGERDFVLAEMRQFLEAVQQISDGLARGDMKQVEAAAKAVGMSTTHGIPPSLRGKLPLEFKKLGFDTHKKFDRLALASASLPVPKELLAQLSEILLNCTGCHAGYKLKVSAPGSVPKH